jgi:alkanesulfonate monooxygenase SsuD/methylene tetrahydromethanopterin reductase-like flavin-dependent oxidoreductase (luciferase family)
MTIARGIGLEGAIGPPAIAEMARLAEQLGYRSFWLNVLGKVEPFECLEQAIARTETIEVGVGLFPLDKHPADEIVARLQHGGIAVSRTILGIAGGQMKQGMLQATADAIGRLHRALPGCRVAAGGYGPKMLALGGREADAILANWSTAERLQWFVDGVKAGSDVAGRAMPPIYLYHRSAAGSDAVQRLEAELREYRRYPAHLKHQQAMGNPRYIGVAAATREDIEPQLAPYAGRCNIVLKPLARDNADLDELRDLLRFFAPHS